MEEETKQATAAIVSAILAGTTAGPAAAPEALVDRYREVLRQLRSTGGPFAVPKKE